MDRTSSPREFDAVIVGAGYGGLICGAILASEGSRVLVLDRTPGIGGSCTSLPAPGGGGILSPYGHASARDTADLFLIMSRRHRFGLEAARRAKVELPLVGPIQPLMRGHVVPEGHVCFIGGGFEEYARKILGVPEALVSRFRESWGQLFALDAETLRGVSLEEWLSALTEADLREAFIRVANIFYSLPASRVSAERFVRSMQTPIEIYYADDPDQGGLAGVVAPYARAIEARGGVIELERELFEVRVKDGRIESLIVQDRTSRLEEIRTPNLVFSHVAHHLFDALDPQHCPPDYVADTLRLREFDADIAMLTGLLSRLPTRREDGLEEDYPGWNRVLRGTERAYGGGWWFPSMSSRAVAPTGRHLVEVGHASGAQAFEPFASVSEARERLDGVLDVMRGYYADLDEVLIDTSFAINRPPNLDNWKFSDVPRPGLRVPGVEGLYLVGASVEVEGAVQDIDANSALQVADLVLERARAGLG